MINRPGLYVQVWLSPPRTCKTYLETSRIIPLPDPVCLPAFNGAITAVFFFKNHTATVAVDSGCGFEVFLCFWQELFSL